MIRGYPFVVGVSSITLFYLLLEWIKHHLGEVDLLFQGPEPSLNHVGTETHQEIIFEHHGSIFNTLHLNIQIVI